tara:strand:- start:146 stop:1201 length:1056 start_codon:yes stop_codon:yes gene_type:complete
MKIYIFCDDPGAANYMSCLPQICIDKAFKITILLTSWDLADYFIDFSSFIKVGRTNSLLNGLRIENPKEDYLLFAGTSEDINFISKIINHSKTYRQLCYCFIDSSVNYEYRFSSCITTSRKHKPDFIVVPDIYTGRCFEKLGFEKQKIQLFSPWWKTDSKRENVKEIKKKWVNNNKKYQVLVASELSSGLGPNCRYQLHDGYKIFGSGKHKGRTEIVIEEILVGLESIRSNVNLSLRPHPKQTRSSLKGLDCFFDVYLDCPRHQIELNNYDLIIGLSSTILFEAASLNIPVLSILPAVCERNWLGFWENHIKTVHTRSDVKAILSNPPIWGQLKNQINHNVTEEIYDQFEL